MVGCLFALPGGSGIRMTLDHVPSAEMPEEIAPPRDQIEETILGFEDVAMGLNPIVGALLYQFVFRPLRRRREEKKKVQA